MSSMFCYCSFIMEQLTRHKAFTFLVIMRAWKAILYKSILFSIVEGLFYSEDSDVVLFIHAAKMCVLYCIFLIFLVVFYDCF